MGEFILPLNFKMNEDITNISIKEYLEKIGIETRREGSKYFASSPFSRDSNWSFVIYPTNTYFDFSTGHGGNIINLVARISGTSLSEAAKQLREGIKYEKYKPHYAKIKEELFKTTEFAVSKYLNKDPEECEQIHQYAASRRIIKGYECGVFFTREPGHGTPDFWQKRPHLKQQQTKWVRNPALMFVHVDKNLKPCGAKFRRLTPAIGSKDQSPRFSARGNLGLYLLGLTEMSSTPFLMNTTSSNVLYVVESETSANSLWSWLTEQHISSVVLSRGGVSSAPKLDDLPEQLQGLQKKLIIDYDGNEELYQQRLKLYKDLDAQPIKLILPKGEDINSLYVKNEMWKVEHILLT